MCLGCMWCFVSLFLVVSTSAINCLERLVSEMTYDVSSGTLDHTHSNSSSVLNCLCRIFYIVHTCQDWFRHVPVYWPWMSSCNADHFMFGLAVITVCVLFHQHVVIRVICTALTELRSCVLCLLISVCFLHFSVSSAFHIWLSLVHAVCTLLWGECTFCM